MATEPYILSASIFKELFHIVYYRNIQQQPTFPGGLSSIKNIFQKFPEDDAEKLDSSPFAQDEVAWTTPRHPPLHASLELPFICYA
ncbi:hypothetical protein CDAR_238791 [Caerostris darwini]|uniref:Maturase K n=1 Tax=Caerostris darwini TaxID=1538125 RepID=A0AAV4PVB3_9ARAC|nr:hypothetical protein CDAR_238791 [Caerostris darwini]